MNSPTALNSLITKSETADRIFLTTGFNYGITEVDNEDGTVSITFDSNEDYAKFKELSK